MLTLIFSSLVLFIIQITTQHLGCNQYTDCLSCTSNNCTYCELPTTDSNVVCHLALDITNPCSFYCPDDNINTPSKCVAPRPNIYDPNIAMEMLLLSTSAYSQTPGKCLINLSLSDNWVQYGTFSAACDPVNSTCFGFTAYSPKNQSIVLAFRGTTAINQILFESIQSLLPTSSWPAGGMVIPYFNDALNLMWPQVQNQMTQLVQKYPNYKIYVTGHSLGGAVASLAASALLQNNITTNASLYTFGEPRVGDYIFSRGFDSQISDAWRVIHYIDPFPHIPFCEYIFVNGPIPVCNPCPGPNIFSYHHGSEVWYNTSQLIFAPKDPHYVCLQGWPRNEALNCSTGYDSFGQDCFNDINNCAKYHEYYFGVDVGSCGESDCSDPVACNKKTFSK